ncbi:hypothetical protein FRB94_003995 [Tulasnella sp. JGI-2019a]|nr:hypothetical protein FRB94_003995 [Tulasnella sp. JGI-2019a]
MESPTLVETDPEGRAVPLSEFALDLWRGHPSRAPSLIDLIVGLWKHFTASVSLMNALDSNISLSSDIIHRSTTVLRSNTATPAVADSDPEPRARSFLNLATEDRSELDNAIRNIEQAMDFVNEGYPVRVLALRVMGGCLMTGFPDRVGRRELDLCIECFQEALELSPEGDPAISSSLNALSLCFLGRFEQGGNRSDLDQSINNSKEALDLQPEGHPDRSAPLFNLANGLRIRFEQNGDRGDLDQSINYYKKALDLRPEGHPDRSMSLSNLASGLLKRFEQNGDRNDLDQSINNYKEALDLRPQGYPNRSMPLSNLASGLLKRFELNRDRNDLDQSIRYYKEALDLQPEGHPDRSRSLSNLAIGLLTRFEQNGDRNDLNQSINNSKEALNLRPEGHPDRSVSMFGLANGLLTQFEQDWNRNDLDQSINYYQESLDLRPQGHPDRSESLDLRPQGHPYRSESLSNLASGLLTRFKQNRDRNDLDQSINYYKEALDLRPEGHPNRSISLSNLASGLLKWFELNRDRNDLDQSIRYCKEALDLQPEGHPDRSRSLSNLAIGLLTRFEQNGDRNDLNQSINNSKEALDLHPKGHPNRSGSLSNLANGLLARFEQNGDRNDLDQSIDYYKGALDLRPKGHLDRSMSLSNLANGLLRRFEQDGDQNYLDQSINNYKVALDLLPEGHPDRSGSLSNLANGLLARFKQHRDPNDLDQSIDYYKEALGLRPEGHPDRSGPSTNLANGLLRRFKQNGDRNDLDQSINNSKEALDLQPEGHPNRSTILSNLASSFLTRFQHSGDNNDMVMSLSMAWDGAVHVSSPVTHRFQASLLWIAMSRMINHPSVMEAYTTSISLLDRHITFARSISTQHSRLRGDFSLPWARSLASDAASYALKESSLEAAVEFLEQGRSVLYSQLGNYRTSLVDLDSVNPGLAEQFRVQSARLEGSVTSSEDQPTSSKTGDVVTRYQRAAAEWARTVESIRKVPGFSSFLKCKPFQELQIAASHGPVVIVNISEFRSDAIVVQRTGLPDIIPLPDAHLEDIDSLSERLSSLALVQDGNAAKMQREMTHILREIWEAIVGPIAIHLECELGLARGSRIWWMPTLKACSLPLHAAGPYIKGQRNMPDRFISSYTPTLSILLRSMDRIEASGFLLGRVIGPRFLLVSQANAEGQRELLSVPEETDKIQSSFPQVVTLEGEAGTRAAVLEGLKDAEWVHLACHGHRNQHEPFKSYFSLHKEADALTLLDIIKHVRPKAELAVLSACHSAQGDQESPDEAVHMAAGMQFSGFKSVVGTLWASEDEDGPIIAEVFYKYMLRNGMEAVDFRESAEALNAATRELRRRGVPLERWINFVHYGA